jgi:hypothetical protein
MLRYFDAYKGTLSCYFTPTQGTIPSLTFDAYTGNNILSYFDPYIGHTILSYFDAYTGSTILNPLDNCLCLRCQGFVVWDGTLQFMNDKLQMMQKEATVA